MPKDKECLGCFSIRNEECSTCPDTRQCMRERLGDDCDEHDSDEGADDGE